MYWIEIRIQFFLCSLCCNIVYYAVEFKRIKVSASGNIRNRRSSTKWMNYSCDGQEMSLRLMVGTSVCMYTQVWNPKPWCQPRTCRADILEGGLESNFTPQNQTKIYSMCLTQPCLWIKSTNRCESCLILIRMCILPVLWVIARCPLKASWAHKWCFREVTGSWVFDTGSQVCETG